MSLKNFIFSKAFLKQLSIAAAIIVALVMILLIWLNFYTRHGQSRAVPEFVGLTIDQTARTAKKSRLRFQIIDSVYTADVPRGCIAEQNPKPGFRVKKRRTINLIINAFNPEMVPMPNLVNLPIRQALASVESAGLETGRLTYIPDISEDVVIKQICNGREIQEGDPLQKGSVVDLVLGKGLSNQRTSVPNLVGMRLEPAVETILASSLNLGTYTYDNTIISGSDSVNAFVYKQIPGYRYDATEKLGSAIYIWMTVDSSKMATDTTSVVYDTIPALQSYQSDN